MATQGEVDAAALAMVNEDPTVMSLLTHSEILDLARAAVEAAERVRQAAALLAFDEKLRVCEKQP